MGYVVKARHRHIQVLAGPPGHPTPLSYVTGLLALFCSPGRGLTRTGEAHTQGPLFFMARWDVASAPVCGSLFTILGGAVNRAITGCLSWPAALSLACACACACLCARACACACACASAAASCSLSVYPRRRKSTTQPPCSARRRQVRPPEPHSHSIAAAAAAAIAFSAPPSGAIAADCKIPITPGTPMPSR